MPQIGRRSGCPWVAAGDRSFPSVLVRKWHILDEAGMATMLVLKTDTAEVIKGEAGRP